MSDTVKVLVWGTAKEGPCAYFRGHLYDEPLKALGVEMRHLTNISFQAGGEYAHQCEGGCQRCVEAVLAGAMELDKSEIEWADVVMFRRYYNTAFKCRLDREGPKCGYLTFDRGEANAHEHGAEVQDLITRQLWPLFRESWTGGIVFETDDDHFKIKPWNGYYQDVVMERDLIADMARRADVLTVSTPALSLSYGRFNERIRVIRNAIDPDLYVKDTPHPGGDKPRLVYYGATARLRDYAGFPERGKWTGGYARVAVEAHKRLLRTVFYGVSEGTEAVVEQYFDEAYPYIEGIAEFSKAIANSHGDIGIAPLGGDDFDRAKSELHWLEYAMSDMAFIGERMGKGGGPYGVVREGVDGLLARGAQEWHDAVKKLATSKTLRDDLAGAAKERVLAEYDYRQRAVEWADAFRFAAENPGIGKRSLARAA